MNFKSHIAVVAILLVVACDSPAEREVRSYLVDPASAQFSHVTTSGGKTCGLVNSRNRLGGMTGNTIFIVESGAVRFGNDLSVEDMQVCSTDAFIGWMHQNGM